MRASGTSYLVNNGTICERREVTPEKEHMKAAIISDIHGNVEALRAVLRDTAKEGCEKVYCLGDVVGYGPSPNECCALVRAMGIETILGNHDEMVATDAPLPELLLNPLAYKSLLWTRETLTAEHRRWLQNLPRSIELPALRACLYHASPYRPEDWDYVVTSSQALDALRVQNQPLCFIGHTHKPFVAGFNPRDGSLRNQAPGVVRIEPNLLYLINVGSVGQPRNHDPRGSYVLLDDTAREIRFQKVVYAVETTQRRIRDERLPDKLAERLAWGI